MTEEKKNKAKITIEIEGVEGKPLVLNVENLVGVRMDKKSESVDIGGFSVDVFTGDTLFAVMDPPLLPSSPEPEKSEEEK